MTKSYIFLITLIFISSCIDSPISQDKNASNKDWSKEQSDIILDSLPALNLFQLKVITQQGEECDWHALRNLLFTISMFEDSGHNFSTQYRALVDENLYEKLVRLRNPSLRQHPQINKIIDSSLNFGDLLPSKSPLYIKQVLEWTRYPNEPGLPMTKEKLAETELPKIEGSANLPSGFPSDIASLDMAMVMDGRYPFYDRVKKLHSNGADGFIPMSLTLNPAGLILNNGMTIRHGVSLLMRKIQGKMEFIFLDSLNWKVSGNKNYLNALSSLVRLSSDAEYLRKSYIRSGYIELLHFAQWPNHKVSHLFDYFYLIEIMGGIDDAFFAQFYKKPVCTMIDSVPSAFEVTRQKEYSNPQSDYVVFNDARIELLRLYKCGK